MLKPFGDFWKSCGYMLFLIPNYAYLCFLCLFYQSFKESVLGFVIFFLNLRYCFPRFIFCFYLSESFLPCLLVWFIIRLTFGVESLVHLLHFIQKRGNCSTQLWVHLTGFNKYYYTRYHYFPHTVHPQFWKSSFPWAIERYDFNSQG